MSREVVTAQPMRRLVWQCGSTREETGPVGRGSLSRTVGFNVSDRDLIEICQVFSTMAQESPRIPELGPEKTDGRGHSGALAPPITTGTRIPRTLLNRLEVNGSRYGLTWLLGNRGHGHAKPFEAVH